MGYTGWDSGDCACTVNRRRKCLLAAAVITTSAGDYQLSYKCQVQCA